MISIAKKEFILWKVAQMIVNEKKIKFLLFYCKMLREKTECFVKMHFTYMNSVTVHKKS